MRLLVLSFFLVATACVTVKLDTAAENDKLRADAAVWFDLFAHEDGPGMGNLYAEDALLMPPGAEAVSGRPAITKFLGEAAAGAKAAGLSLKNREVTGSGVDGDTAWISGTYDVVDVAGKVVDRGNYLSVHRKINGTWLYIRDTWNSDQKPAPPAPPSVEQAPAPGSTAQ